MHVGFMRTSEQPPIELGPIQKTHLHFCFGNSVLRAGVVLTTVFIKFNKRFLGYGAGRIGGGLLLSSIASVPKEFTPLQLPRS